MQYGNAAKDIGPVLKNSHIFQRGYGQCCSASMRITRRQGGNGVGNLFSKMYRYIKPFVIKGLKEIGREAVHAGADILDQSETKPLSEAVKSRGKQALRNLKRKATDNLEKVMRGAGDPKKHIKRVKTQKATQSRAIRRRKKPRNSKNNKKTARKRSGKKRVATKDIFS